MKKALITGITGQDGSYLAELLLSKGYEVHGLIRRASTFNTGRLDAIYADPHLEKNRLHLHYGDLADASALARLLGKIQPQEIYNLAAQSHVRVSFDCPEYTADITGTGTIRLLEAIRETGLQTRFYQASSSEMYGLVQEVPQSEKTPFYPRSPYGCAKVFSFWLTVNYRESYGLHASNGILFNHESPRRGETFVTRKITRAVAQIKAGLQQKLYLGNLDAKRDWGYAKEYVEAMWLMLQQDQPDDYVIATNEAHSIREFLDVAFGRVQLDWQKHVEIDPRYYRPAEVELLIGDYGKARQKLGWEPKTKFADLAKLMVDADIDLLKAHQQGRVKVSNCRKTMNAKKHLDQIEDLWSLCPEIKNIMVGNGRQGRSGKMLQTHSASTTNNLLVIANMVLDLNVQNSLEIGMAFGTSTLAFLAAKRYAGIGIGKHVSIDPFQLLDYDDCGVMAVERAELNDEMEVRYAYSSVELPRELEAAASYDLIYVDGSHLFEDAFVDAYFAIRLLRKGGVVLFDDNRDNHVAKVAKFLRTNLAHSLTELDLSQWRGNCGKDWRYRVARRLGCIQLSGFQKTDEVRRKYGDPLVRFLILGFIKPIRPEI